jgi:hypothetical protein
MSRPPAHHFSDFILWRKQFAIFLFSKKMHQQHGQGNFWKISKKNKIATFQGKKVLKSPRF